MAPVSATIWLHITILAYFPNKATDWLRYLWCDDHGVAPGGTLAGMMLGCFGSVYLNWVYLNWVYLTWLPGYLRAERHMDLAHGGLVASIPLITAGYASCRSPIGFKMRTQA